MVVAKIRKNNGATFRMDSKIASNSYAAVDGDLVSLTSGLASKTGVGAVIEGVSKETKTFASDNATVGKEKVHYIPAQDGLTLEMTADATIVDADCGKFYNINADQTVDVATGTLTKTSALNLRLVEVKSSTVGLFEIDNDLV